MGSRQIVEVNHEDKSATILKIDNDFIISENTLTASTNIQFVDNDQAPVLNNLMGPNYTYTPPYMPPLTNPPDSSVTRTEAETQDMYYDAINAEDNSRKAKNTLAASFVLLIFPIFGFFLSILFFGIGSSYYSKAKNSRYNTDIGVGYEESARKWSIAYLIAMALTILLVAVIIALAFI